MHTWHTEHRHHRVANELLHRATVALDGSARDVEVTRHHPAYRLRVNPLTQARGARDITEKNSDNLPLLARRLPG
jgi:hypothetical protein